MTNEVIPTIPMVYSETKKDKKSAGCKTIQNHTRTRHLKRRIIDKIHFITLPSSGSFISKSRKIERSSGE